MQVFSRFDDDFREADRRRRDVVILERLQRPRRGLFLGQNRVRRRIYFFQVVGADELLQKGDVRVVRLIQREALRKILEQTSVGVFRMLNYRRVWLERNVDRRDRVLLRPRSCANATANPSQSPTVMMTSKCLCVGLCSSRVVVPI